MDIQSGILSFLPESSNRPLVLDRHKHNRLQLAISQDSPSYFKSKDTALHPFLRETMYKHDKSGSNRAQSYYEMKSIQRLGKSINVKLSNHSVQKHQQNLNMIEERKINETSDQAEERLIRKSTNQKQVFDIIGHRDYSTGSGGDIHSQISQYLVNYKSALEKDKDIFRFRSGEFEQFINQNQSPKLKELEDNGKLKWNQKLSQRLSTRLDNSQDTQSKSKSNYTKIFKSSVHSNNLTIGQIKQKQLELRLPSISTKGLHSPFFVGDKILESKPSDEPNEHQRIQYLLHHRDYDNNQSKEIATQMMNQFVIQNQFIKDRLKKSIKRKQKTLNIIEPELNNSMQDIDEFQRGIKILYKKSANVF